jgi:Flp pilus assembly protein TadD
MRTLIRSWAVLALLSPVVGACAGGASKHAASYAPAPSPFLDRAGVSSPEECLARAGSLSQAGAQADALAILAAAQREHPDNAPILSAYGRQALIMGEEALAERLLKQALEADPDDWRALSAQAALAGRRGRLAGARHALDRARTLSGGHAVVLNNLGMSHLLDGNAPEAARLFRQALIAADLTPVHAGRIKRNLAVALAVEGDFELADRLAGETLPRGLKDARREAIANFMGMGAGPAFDRGGWTARLADASASMADPSWR